MGDVDKSINISILGPEQTGKKSILKTFVKGTSTQIQNGPDGICIIHLDPESSPIQRSIAAISSNEHNSEIVEKTIQETDVFIITIDMMNEQYLNELKKYVKLINDLKAGSPILLAAVKFDQWKSDDATIESISYRINQCKLELSPVSLLDIPLDCNDATNVKELYTRAVEAQTEMNESIARARQLQPKIELLNSLPIEIDGLKQQLEKLKHEKDQLQQNLDQALKSAEPTRQELQDIQFDNGLLAKQLQLANEAKTSITKEYESLKAEFNDGLALKDELNKNVLLVASQLDIIKNLTNNVESLIKDFDVLQQENERLKSEITDLKAQKQPEPAGISDNKSNNPDLQSTAVIKSKRSQEIEAALQKYILRIQSISADKQNSYTDFWFLKKSRTLHRHENLRLAENLLHNLQNDDASEDFQTILQKYIQVGARKGRGFVTLTGHEINSTELSDILRDINDSAKKEVPRLKMVN